MDSKTIDLLAQARLFEGCGRESLETFFRAVPHRVRRRHKGDCIARTGDELADAVLLTEGSVYSRMTKRNGKEVVIEILTGPVMLAPAFVFARENLAPVSVIARTECTLLYLDKPAFGEQLHKDRQLMMNYIGILSDRCQKLSRRLGDFALLSLRERVSEYLRRHRRIENVEWLSQLMGVARPSLSRVLSGLKAEGLIERTIDGLEIKYKQI